MYNINSIQDKFKNPIENTSKHKDRSLKIILKYVTRFCDLRSSKALSVFRIVFLIIETIFSLQIASIRKSTTVVTITMLAMVYITAFSINYFNICPN